MRGSIRSTRVLTSLGALSLVAAACGSSSSSSTSSAPALTGPPINLMLINNTSSQRDLSEIYAGAEAAAHAINDAGGEKGRPIHIVHCDSQITPDGTAACSRKAVADPTILALAGTYVQYGDQVDPILEPAGMANIGDFPQAIEDMTSKISFPTTSGALGSVAGMATLVTDVLHSNAISVPYVDVPEGAQVTQLLAGVLQTRNAQIVTKVPVPDHAPDLSAAVQASTANNPGGIILVLSVDAALQFLQTAHSQAVSIPLVQAGAEESEAAVAKLGPASEGTYITTAFPSTGGEGNSLFNQQMDKYAPNETRDDLAKNAWLAVRLFYSATKDLPSLTRASVLNAMNNLASFDTGGLTPPLNFTQPWTGFGGTFPRLFNHTVVYNKVTGGKFVPITGQFADPFTPPGG